MNVNIFKVGLKFNVPKNQSKYTQRGAGGS